MLIGSYLSYLSGKEKTAVSRVRQLISSGTGAPDFLNTHSIFCQMDELCHFEDGAQGWKETAR